MPRGLGRQGTLRMGSSGAPVDAATPLAAFPDDAPDSDFGENKSSKGAHRPRIISSTEAPEWARLPFISHGYRADHSTVEAIRSIFSLHSETLNIWTHLIAAIYVWSLFSEVDAVMSRVSIAEPFRSRDRACFYFYVVCAEFLLVCSVLFHTLRCVSEWHANALLRADLVGIVVLFMGHMTMGLNVALAPCLPIHLYCYGVALFASLFYPLALAIFSRNIKASFDRINTSLASVLAFGLVPLGHLIYLTVSLPPPHPPGIFSLMVGATFSPYVLGFALFITGYPERLFPDGSFDLVGASHQFWHVGCALGIVFGLRGFLDFYEWRGAVPRYC